MVEYCCIVPFNTTVMVFGNSLYKGQKQMGLAKPRSTYVLSMRNMD